MKKRETALAAAQVMADGARAPYAVLRVPYQTHRWAAEAVSFLATRIGSARYPNPPHVIVEPVVQVAPVRKHDA